MQVIQNKSLSLLETLVTTLDQSEQLQKRPKYFARGDLGLEQAVEDSQKALGYDAPARGDRDDVAPTEKFKELSLELLDMGLYTGQKGIEKIQQTRPYAISDQFIHYDKRYKELKKGSKKLYRFLNDKLYNPLKNNLYVIYDQGSNYISFFIRVLHEHQAKVADYIHRHYENVQVLI